MTAFALPPTAQPGDRLPDAWLGFAQGERSRLHARQAGRPRWLVVLEPGASPLLPRLQAGDGLCVAASAEAVAADGWIACTADAGWRALFEPGVIYRLDENLRIVDMRPGHVSSLPPLSTAVAALAPSDTSRCAPVLQAPRVFDDSNCSALIDHLVSACGGGVESLVVALEDGVARPESAPDVKIRRESAILDPDLDRHVHAALQRRLAPEIARIFQFQVARRDPFKLLAYPADAGYFRAHRDNDTRDVAYRRFAISINLNPGDYDGGHFRFPEFGPHLYSPDRGGALVFSCSLLHEVVPVARGTRYALTTFVA